MAWSFEFWICSWLEASGFEILGKVQVLLSRNLEGRARKRLIYHAHPLVLPVWGPPQTEVFRYFFWSSFLMASGMHFFALGRVQDDFGTQHGPNLDQIWSHVGPFFWHFWGVVLASQNKVVFKTIFDWFLTTRILKNTAPANVFDDFCICFMIALETDLGPILAPFWTPKSIQNRSRNG